MLDAAICDAQSHDLHQRWSNYYVAGLDWLVSEPPHMDGLYLGASQRALAQRGT